MRSNNMKCTDEELENIVENTKLEPISNTMICEGLIAEEAHKSNLQYKEYRYAFQRNCITGQAVKFSCKTHSLCSLQLQQWLQRKTVD